MNLLERNFANYGKSGRKSLASGHRHPMLCTDQRTSHQGVESDCIERDIPIKDEQFQQHSSALQNSGFVSIASVNCKVKQKSLPTRGMW